MDNGVIMPPHDFTQPSHWYYQVWKGTKYDFRRITYGITSMTNFIKNLKDIIQLLNADAYKWVSQVKFKIRWVGLG
jgi:hypothetical protein